MNNFKERAKEHFSSFSWKVNNFNLKVKRKVKSFFVNIFNKITFKNKRDERKELKYKEVRIRLNLEEDTNLIYDIDLDKIIDDINNENKELKIKLHNQGITNINEIKEKIKYNKEILRLLPKNSKTRYKKENAKIAKRKIGKALLYLWPAILLLAIFSFYQILNAFRIVIFDNYNEITGEYDKVTLFGNFIKVLNDANFIIPAKHTGSSAMINTLIIVIFTVPISVIIALIISTLLVSIKPFQNFFQTIFFLPYVTNSLAVGLVFAYMFKTDGGLVNKFLNVFGINGGSWVGVGAPYWKAMFVLILFSIWNGLAFKIMVFSSSIQGIDKQYYQAASIDATPKFKQFRRITVPLISPVILYIFVTSIIGAFKTYSSVIAIFGNSGKPPGATYTLKTIVFYIYDFFSVTGKFAEAAAASIILFVLILLLTIVQMKVSKKRVHY